MTTYNALCDMAKDLAALLKPKQRHALPPDVIAEACRAMDLLKATLSPFFPPSAQEKKAAKAHPTGSQIAVFTTAAPERKRFFTIAYFRNRFQALPANERRIIVSTAPKTLAGFRDALILYYYREGKQSGQDMLRQFQAEVETDYNSLPHVQAYHRMKSLYRELLVVRNEADLSCRLSTAFPDENDLAQFAKINKLKIPAQKKSKNAPQTTPHERLAELIFKKGSLARLDIG